MLYYLSLIFSTFNVLYNITQYNILVVTTYKFIYDYNYIQQTVCILKPNVNSVLTEVNTEDKRLAPVQNHVKWFKHSSDIWRIGCCVPRSNCCYFVYNPWTILVCSRRLYLFLKVRLQNWQTAVGMPLCWVRIWRRRLPIDKTEGQCGQYSVPRGGKGTGVPTNSAGKENG